MKFGKITSQNVSTNAISVAGALAGGAISNGLMTLVPEKQELLARGGMAVTGLVGAASVKGTNSTEKLVKFLLLGFGIAQGAALIKKFSADQIQIDESSSASEKFVAGMAGLACPCEDNYAALASPVINFAALNPSDEYQPAKARSLGAF
jgi:hypothetical protein